MWNRAGLKANAKENLRNFYWPAFLVCIITGLFSGGGSAATSGRSAYDSFESAGGAYGYTIDPLLLSVIVSIIIGAAIFGIVLRIFVGNLVIVGKNRYFMCNREVKTGMGELFYGFRNGCFVNVVKTMFLKDLYIFLWSLLLVIPGIIKAYEYAMVPYILAENPGIESRRAFELSREMMRGEKFNYFVLELSFFGWALLGILACCVGIYFVQPYMEATLAEFYGMSREKILASGVSSSYEMRGFTERI